MSFVSDIAAIGSMIMVAFFALWMVKQLFTDNN